MFERIRVSIGQYCDFKDSNCSNNWSFGAYFFKNYKSEGYKIYALVELFIGIFGIFSFGFLSEISIHMANFFPTPIELLIPTFERFFLESFVYQPKVYRLVL
jgi:hypothetical protein